VSSFNAGPRSSFQFFFIKLSILFSQSFLSKHVNIVVLFVFIVSLFFYKKGNILIPSDTFEKITGGVNMAYSDKVVDHFENPKNVGSFDKGEAGIGTGVVGAPACGDVMKLQLKISDEGVIEDAKFKTFGCGSAIASSSLVTEWVKGRTLEEAEVIKNSDIAQELSLPPVKIHCSVLAEDAIKAAIKNYRDKNKG
jgi:nitrogen fixation NifU-like protein